MEDMYAGSHLIQFGLAQMGILPTVTFDANILISNGLGNLDEDGRLIEHPTRLAVRGLFKTIEIVCRYAGLDPCMLRKGEARMKPEQSTQLNFQTGQEARQADPVRSVAREYRRAGSGFCPGQPGHPAPIIRVRFSPLLLLEPETLPGPGCYRPGQFYPIRGLGGRR